MNTDTTYMPKIETYYIWSKLIIITSQYATYRNYPLAQFGNLNCLSIDDCNKSGTGVYRYIATRFLPKNIMSMLLTR